MRPDPTPGPAGARAAVADDLARLVELYEAAVSELGNMRGGRILLGLDGRPRPLPASFRRQMESPDEHLVVGTAGGEVVGYGSCLVRALPGPSYSGSSRSCT